MQTQPSQNNSLIAAVAAHYLRRRLNPDEQQDAPGMLNQPTASAPVIGIAPPADPTQAEADPRIQSNLVRMPPPPQSQVSDYVPPPTAKAMMETPPQTSRLAGLIGPPPESMQPPPSASVETTPPIQTRALPPSIQPPPSLLDRARAEYQNAVTAPVKKEKWWKDALAYGAEAANNVFNPAHPVAYQGFGAVKHDKAVEAATRQLAPLQQMADADLERQRKQTADDYQKAQIGNYADVAADRKHDNDLNDKKLTLEQQKADAKTFLEHWRLTNADQKLATYQDYVKGQLDLGNRKLLSQTEFNNAKMEHDTARLNQQWEISLNNNKTRLGIAKEGNATRERIANGSLEQKNLANGIRQKYTAAQIIQNGQKNFNSKEEINQALTTAGFPPLQ